MKTVTDVRLGRTKDITVSQKLTLSLLGELKRGTVTYEFDAIEMHASNMPEEVKLYCHVKR